MRATEGEARIEPMISVLRADPTLAADLQGRSLAEARSAAVARSLVVPEGPWHEAETITVSAGPGLLVLSGAVYREVTLLNQHSIEFLGRGDLLRPWDADDERLQPIPAGACYFVINRLRLAALDRDFCLRVARWPEIYAAVVGRAMQRARRLTYELAAAQATVVDERLWLVLWHLADRWGRVTNQGTRLEMPGLTHERLALMVHTRRPAVTLAISRMRELGLLAPARRRHVLCKSAPDGLAILREQSGRPASAAVP